MIVYKIYYRLEEYEWKEHIILIIYFQYILTLTLDLLQINYLDLFLSTLPNNEHPCKNQFNFCQYIFLSCNYFIYICVSKF